MDLKSYDQAIGEFRQAINDEPKNIEARYLIARCYHLQNDPLGSLTWIRETLSVAPNHSAALSLRTTIQQQGINYLSSSDRQVQSLGLRIVAEVPSSAAVPPLKSLMMSSDPDVAAVSEKLILRINPSEARAAWISWLGSPDQRLKEAGAEKLWDLEKYNQAAPILREKYVKLFLGPQRTTDFSGIEDYPAREAAPKLVEFGWPEAIETLISAVRDRSKVAQAIIAADLLAQRKERRGVPALMERFSAWLPGGKRLMGCQSPYPQLADALGKIGATEAVPLLKEAMSNCLSDYNFELNLQYFDKYLDALTNLTGEAWSWEQFYVWSHGVSAVGQVTYNLEDIKNNADHVRWGNRIDENSPNAPKIYQWLKSLEPYNPLMGLGVSLVNVSTSGYVKIHSPREMKYYGDIFNSDYIIKGEYILSLRATGDPNRAWIVTDVTMRPCDRCGLNVTDLLPANIESGGGASPSPAKTACADAADLGYSLLLGGSFYRVKGIASPTGGQVHVFNVNGSLVRDPGLLKELAWGAWVREKIVASHGTRTRNQAIAAILAGSQAVQRNEMALDALTSGMAVALGAAVTGGASLAEAVPNLAWSFVRSQLASPRAARTLFLLSGQNGLRLSLEKYNRLEANLPPEHSRAIDINDLRKKGVEELYFDAYLTELPNEALVAALMPGTNGLMDDALQRILAPILLSLPGAKEVVTLQDLFNLQKSLAEAGKDFPALRAYYDSLRQAMELRQSTDVVIARWAQESATACGESPPTQGSGSNATDILGRSPSDVVKAVYASCNDGRYSEAEKLLSAAALAAVHNSGGMKGVCDTNTKHGAITNVEITGEQIRGERTTVMARIHFRDGSTTENDRTELVKESSAWKIVFE